MGKIADFDPRGHGDKRCTMRQVRSNHVRFDRRSELAKETLMLGGVRSILNEGPAADSAAHSTIHVEPALSLRSKDHSARIVRARLTSPRLSGERYPIHAGRAAQATSIRRPSCPFARPSTASPRTIIFLRIPQFSGKGSNVSRLTIELPGSSD